MSLRLAVIRDLKTVEKIVDEAYSVYVDRIGKPPAPVMQSMGHARFYQRVCSSRVSFMYSNPDFVRSFSFCLMTGCADVGSINFAYIFMFLFMNTFLSVLFAMMLSILRF